MDFLSGPKIRCESTLVHQKRKKSVADSFGGLVDFLGFFETKKYQSSPLRTSTCGGSAANQFDRLKLTVS